MDTPPVIRTSVLPGSRRRDLEVQWLIAFVAGILAGGLIVGVLMAAVGGGDDPGGRTAVASGLSITPATRDLTDHSEWHLPDDHLITANQVRTFDLQTGRQLRLTFRTEERIAGKPKTGAILAYEFDDDERMHGPAVGSDLIPDGDAFKPAMVPAPIRWYWHGEEVDEAAFHRLEISGR